MNKIIVSIVLAIILVFGINKIADIIYYVEKPEKSAYQVESLTTVASTTTAETSSDSDSEDIMSLFASTNAAEGAKVFKKCLACHSNKTMGVLAEHERRHRHPGESPFLAALLRSRRLLPIAAKQNNYSSQPATFRSSARPTEFPGSGRISADGRRVECAQLYE